MSHAKKKKIAIIVLASTAALLAAGTVSGVLYAHQSATKRSKNNDKKPEIQDISELEKKIEAIRDSHKQNLKNEAWKILEALKITIRNAKKANNVRDLSQVISDFERLIPLGEAYLNELKKLPELEALTNDLKNVIDLAKEVLKEAKEKLLGLQQKEKILKGKLQTLLNKIAQAIAKEPNANDVATIETLIAELRALQIESDDLAQSLKAAKLLEELKLLNDANLKIKETISILQKRLIAINPEKQKEITKQANQKIIDLEKSQKDVENANDISTLPNAIKKLEKDLEDAKSLEKDAKDDGLNDVAKKLQDAINKGQEALKKGKEKEQKIIEANNALIKKVNELVAKITKDVNDANQLSAQSEDSLINNTKSALEEDIKQAEKLAKQAEDATLLAEVNKVKDAKYKAEEALKKINEIIAQKQAIELAKLELQKSLSELDKATKNANLADDESTLPTAIASLTSAIANSNTTLAKYEDLKENEVIKPHYDALKNYLANEAKNALEQAKNRQEAKKQAKAQIDKDLAKAKADYESIKKTIDALESTDKIAELQNIINNSLPALKNLVKGIEQSAESTKYPEAKEKAKELLKQIDKLTLEAQAKLEKLKKDKEAQEQDNQKLQDLRQKLKAVIKNLGIVSDRAKSQLAPGTSANNTEIAKAIKEIEEQLTDASVTRAEVLQANKQAELTNELNKLTEAEDIAKDLKAQLLAKIEASNQDIANKITEARAKLNQYVQNANDANDQKNLANLLAAMKNLEKLLEEAQEIQTLAIKVGSNKLAEAQTLTDDVNKALSDAKAKYEKLKKSLEDEQSLLDSLNKAIEKQSKTLNDAKQEADKATTINDKDNKYGLLDKALQNAKTELDKIKENAKDLKDQANKDSINNKINDLEKQISDNEEDLKKKQEELTKDKEKNDKLIKDLTDEADDAISKANDAIKNPSDKNKTKEAEDALKDAHKKLNEEKDKLKGDAQNLEKITKKLEEIEQKQQDLANVKKQQEQSKEARAKELAEQAKQLQTELENLVKELKEKIKFTDITAKANEVENKVNNINGNFLKVGGEADKLKDHDHLKDAYKELKKAIDDAAKEASDAKNKITTDRQALNDRFKSLEASTTTVKNDLNSAGNDKQKLNEVISKLEGQDKLLEQVQKLIEDITKVDPDSELLAKAKELQTELNSSLETAKDKLKTKDKEIAKLNESLEKKTQELTTQTTNTNGILKENVDTLDVAIKKLEELKTQANTSKTEIDTKRADNDIKNGTEQKYQALVKAIKDAQDAIDKKQTELATQKAQNKTNIVDPAIEKAKDAIDALNTANNVPSLKDTLENKHAEAKQSLEQAIQQLEKDKDNKKLVEDKLKELEDATKKAKEKLDKLNQSEDKELQNILSELDKIEKSLKDAKDAFGDSDTIDQKTAKKDALQRAIAQAKNDLQTQSEKANKLQDPTKKKQATDRIDQINQAIKDTYQPLVETKEHEIQQAKAKNSQKVDSALTESKKSLEQADQAIGDDNSNFDKSQKLNDAKTKLNETQKELNDLKDELTGDSENQAKVQEELTKITKKLQDLEQAKKDLEQSENQKAEALADEAKRLKQELDNLVNALDAANSKWSKSNNDIATIENKISNEINKYLAADSEASKLKNNPKLNQAYRELEKSKEDAKTKIDAAKKLIENAKKGFKEKLDGLEAKVNPLQSELNNANTIEKLNSLIQKIGDDNNGLLKEFKELAEQISKFDKSGGEFLTRLNNLKAQVKTILETAKDKKRAIDEKIANYKEEIQQLIDAIKGAQKTLNELGALKIDELERALNSLKNQLDLVDPLKQKIDKESSQVIKDALKEKISELDKAAKEAKNDYDTKKVQKEQKEQELKDRVEDFKEQINALSKESSDARDMPSTTPEQTKDKWLKLVEIVQKWANLEGTYWSLIGSLQGYATLKSELSNLLNSKLLILKRNSEDYKDNLLKELKAKFNEIANKVHLANISNENSLAKLREWANKYETFKNEARQYVETFENVYEIKEQYEYKNLQNKYNENKDATAQKIRDYIKTIEDAINHIANQVDSLEGLSQSERDQLKNRIKQADSIQQAQEILNEARADSENKKSQIAGHINNLLNRWNKEKTRFEQEYVNKIGSPNNDQYFIHNFYSISTTHESGARFDFSGLRDYIEQRHFKYNDSRWNTLINQIYQIAEFFKEQRDRSNEANNLYKTWNDADIPFPNKDKGKLELLKSRWNQPNVINSSRQNVEDLKRRFAETKQYWDAVKEYSKMVLKASYLVSLIADESEMNGKPRFWWRELKLWNESLIWRNKNSIFGLVYDKNLQEFWMSEIEQVIHHMKTNALISHEIFTNEKRVSFDQHNHGNALYFQQPMNRFLWNSQSSPNYFRGNYFYNIELKIKNRNDLHLLRQFNEHKKNCIFAVSKAINGSKENIVGLINTMYAYVDWLRANGLLNESNYRV